MFKDKIKVMDSLHDENGRLLAGGYGHGVIGEVETIYESKYNGRSVLTRTIGYNDLLVTGAVYLSEKINNRRSTFNPSPIDVSLGVHTAEEIDTTAKTIPSEKICGIMVGNGGCGDTYNTVHKVHRTDLAVPGMVPFRVLTPTEEANALTDGTLVRNNYFLRVERGGLIYYYGKKFTMDPTIHVLYEDGTVVPDNVSVIGDKDNRLIKTFTKYTAMLDSRDIREYFKHTQGSTMRSLVNSVGLLTGYPGKAKDNASAEEFFNVRGLTTLNRENGELKDSEATLTFVYRFYFV